MPSFVLVLDLLSCIILGFQIVVVEIFVDPLDLSRVKCGATGLGATWCFLTKSRDIEDSVTDSTIHRGELDAGPHKEGLGKTQFHHI